MKMIILEGIDAIGKSEIVNAINKKLEKENYKPLIINRNFNVNLNEDSNKLYKLLNNWFKNSQENNTVALQCTISLLQLQFILDELKKYPNDIILIDSWWGKSLCNLMYKDVVNGNFNEEQLFIRYEFLMSQIKDIQKTFLITAKPKDAYKIYVSKNKPETILGKNDFDQPFYERYVSNVQSLLRKLGDKYNFIEINTKYQPVEYKKVIDEIATKIIHIAMS